MKNHSGEAITAALVLALVLTTLGAPLASAAPAITTVSPATGASNGGDLVTITGTGFDTPTVTFGGTPAWIQASTSTSITAVAPPHAAGAVDVVVRNAGGSPVTKDDAFTYAAGTAPALTAREPTAGSTNGGTEVTLTGTGFMPGAVVRFGDDLAPRVVYLSSTELKATAPPITALGSVDVEVQNPDGSASQAMSFSYQSPEEALEVVSLSPDSGPAAGGMHVTISGSGFSTPSVKFGEVAAQVLSSTATALKVIAPPHPLGDVVVMVTNPNGESASTTFHYGGEMKILGVEPAEASTRGGTQITITGTGFPDDGAVRAHFGTAEASPDLCQVSSSTQVTCIAPPALAGSKTLVLTNLEDGRSASINGALDYVPDADPSIAAVVENNGDSNGGTEVLIGGAGFSAVPGHSPTVWFGDVQVPTQSITVEDSDQIYVLVPPRPGTTSDIEVRVRVVNPDGSSTSETSCTQDGAIDPGCFRYQEALAPSSALTIQPSTGSSNGGQTVEILGQGIHPDAIITFGGNPAIHVSHSDGSAELIVPPIDHTQVPAGGLAVDVVVTNPDGQQAEITDGFTYTDSPQPAGTLQNQAGPATGGSVVTVTGSGLAASDHHKPIVRLGGTTIPEAFVEAVSPTQLRFTTPGGAPGSRDLTVENPDGQSFAAANAFLYTSVDAPSLTSASLTTAPATGSVTVTLTGTGFAPIAPIATVNGEPVAVAASSATTLQIVLPSGTGTAAITVTNPDGQTSEALDILYMPPVPVLESISPQATATENGGLGVNLDGRNLPTSGFSLRMGEVPMRADGNPTASIIGASVPPMPVDGEDLHVDVSVGDSLGQTATLRGFTYTNAADPACTSVSPKQVGVNPGAQITLTGSGLTRGATILLDDEVYGQRIVSSNSLSSGLTFTTPSGSYGPVDITVTNANGDSCTLPRAFGYVPLINPVLTAVSPAGGGLEGGEQVTLTGANFRAGATVKFGEQAAAVASISATSITATAPSQEEKGAVDVHVTNPGGLSATLAEGYLYSEMDPPTIATVAPTSGPSLGGTAITITGTGFVEGATLSIGGAMVQDITLSDSGLTMTATTPPHAPAEDVEIVIVNPDAQAASKADAFTYTASPAPTITDIAPSAGPSTGGTSVKIIGTNFAPGATVRIGGAAATGAVVNAAGTQLTVTTPPGVGPNDVRVRNADTQQATKTDGFTYWAAATLDVAKANADLMTTVKVKRSGSDNVVQWTLSALDDPPAGVQLWRTMSPFELIATLEGNDASAGSYTDVGVSAEARYLVTAYYTKTTSGGFVTDVLTAPGYAGLEEEDVNASAAGILNDSRWDVPQWAMIAAAAGLVVTIVMVVLVLRRKRKGKTAPGQALPAGELDEVYRQAGAPAAWEWQGPQALAAMEQPTGDATQWRLDCPICKQSFVAFGNKPFHTNCTHCGVRGFLA